MIKKIVVSGAIFCSCLGFARATSDYPAADTTDLLKKDSVPAARPLPADPKAGFKELFVPAGQSNGMRVEQLNPLAVGFVKDYMEKNSASLEEMKDWARPYFDMIDGILTQHNLPRELKYLAVIESKLQSNARSWAGAVGPWQFMPTTARTMGLTVNRKRDDRRDLSKSTHAASKYLSTLYTLYEDWLLVIAAYNGGPGAVNNAIRKSGSRDFWTLQKYLPAESRNHVKKFIATHYIMEGEGGITTLTKDEVAYWMTNGPTPAADVPDGQVMRPISGRYQAAVIASYLVMPVTDFNQLNPDFDKLVAVNGKYDLRLPADKMELFQSRKPEILATSLQYILNPGMSLPAGSEGK